MMLRPLAGRSRWRASDGEVSLGFVKTRKHSVSDILQVIDGSKIISPCWFCMACVFFSFRWRVSVKLSFWGSSSGSNLSCNLFRISCAITAHLWGLLHPLLRSVWHVSQAQLLRLVCLWVRFVILLLIVIRSLIVLAR